MTRRLRIDVPTHKATDAMPLGLEELDPEADRDVDRDRALEEMAARDPAQDLVGKVLAGRYRVTKVLGRGGVGVVFDGVHIELGRRVAIKVLQAGYARDSEALERFEREARTASKIGHPNIVAVLDLGRLETGEPFFVMEHLQGRDLEDEMTPDGLRIVPTAERTLELLEAIASALDTLHREGIVHRDVKPANVFLSKTTGGLERVKLVDFGLATLADAERKGERLTREGFIVGTAEYMAPECARGALGGPPADVYSLAVMAFELLSGTLPFDGAPIDVVIEKVRGPAPALSVATRARYAAEVDAVLARALDRDPRRRHKSCGAFVEDLAEALARPATAGSATSGSATALLSSADPTSTTDELPRTNDRRWMAIAAAVTAVLLIGGIGIGLFASEPTAPATTTASTVPRGADLVVPDRTPTPEVLPSGADEPLVAVAAVAVVPTEPVEHPPATAHPPPRSRPPASEGTAPDPPSVATSERPTRIDPEATSAVEPGPAIATEPTASAPDLVRQAQSALLRGEAAHARDLFRDATRVSPRHAPAWRGLGVASEQLHERAEARRAFERYLEIAPDAGDAAAIRGRVEALGG